MAENHVLLETINLTQSAASVTFDNIPQTGYTDLKVVASTRDTYSAANLEVFLRLNNNSGSVYSYRRIQGNGSSASSFGAGGGPQTSLFVTGHPGATATSNTFSNFEIYIPNYLGSTAKSLSIDGVDENNTTTAYTTLNAGFTSDTSAINRIDLLCQTAFAANSTFSLYGVAAVGTTPAVAPKATGGNMVSTDGTYWYHTFLSSGTFIPQTNLTCDYLVVAGGGGGATNVGGGGGAGGMRSTVTATGGGGSLESPLALASNTNYVVTIGAGGSGFPHSGPGVNGTSGSNSVFASITSTGGGYGSYGGQPAGNGGSGGGSGGSFTTGNTAGSASPAGQGFNGGRGTQSAGSYPAGGGGGAGAVGVSPASGTANGGDGGTGVATSISGSSVTYAGGGGGSRDSAGQLGTGGSGGGGAASYNTTATSGTANTGGGGGGTHIGTAGNGGSGIVIIRYAMA